MLHDGSYMDLSECSFSHNKGPERYFFERLFGACRRRTPRAKFGWEGGVGKVSARRAFGHLQIDAVPRRSPSACAEILKKKNENARSRANNGPERGPFFWCRSMPTAGAAGPRRDPEGGHRERSRRGGPSGILRIGLV